LLLELLWGTKEVLPSVLCAPSVRHGVRVPQLGVGKVLVGWQASRARRSDGGDCSGDVEQQSSTVRRVGRLAAVRTRGATGRRDATTRAAKQLKAEVRHEGWSGHKGGARDSAPTAQRPVHS
jgi:hypothetical protein